MCAEFGVKSPAEEVVAHFQLATTPTAPLAANYFPKAQVPVVGLKDDGVTRNLIRVRWGLVPNHYPDPDSGPRPFNAKAERVHRLWTFRESFRERRCLFPADQFFEWTGTRPKRRFRCGLRTGGLVGELRVGPPPKCVTSRALRDAVLDVVRAAAKPPDRFAVHRLLRDAGVKRSLSTVGHALGDLVRTGELVNDRDRTGYRLPGQARRPAQPVLPWFDQHPA